jgi:hypothetical protein
MGKKKQRNKGNGRKLSLSQMELTAYHEAGHVVMYLALGLKFDYVTVEPEKTDGMSHSQDGILYQSCAQIRFKEPIEMDNRQLVLTSIAGPIIESMLCGHKDGGYDRPEFRSDYELAYYAAKEEHEDIEEAARYIAALETEAAKIISDNGAAVSEIAKQLLRLGTVSYDAARFIFLDLKPTSPETAG